MSSLLEINPFWGTVGMILGPASIGYLIIKSIIDKNKRKAEIKFQDANTIKTDAETQKTLAEAQKIKADADAVSKDIALDIVSRLNEECKMAKQELREKDKMLDDTQAILDNVRESLRVALTQLTSCRDSLETCQNALTKEREQNAEWERKNSAMWSQIVELTSELNKLKSNH